MSENFWTFLWQLPLTIAVLFFTLVVCAFVMKWVVDKLDL